MAGTEIQSGALTHTGLVRQTNQDSFGSWEPTSDGEIAAKGRLYVVCDGMGGAAGGEIASKLGVDTVIARYKADASGNVAEALRLAVEAANKAIWDTAKEKPELTGMGSTCVALVIKNGMAYLAHDGDSRGYMLRGEELVQLTKDHSMVQQMLDAGIIEEDEVADHPRKNVIMRCLGVKPEIEVELTEKAIEPGDIFYLCTDGLWGLVKKDEVKRIILEHKDDLKAAANALLDTADKHGGTDNSTVSIVQVKGGGGPAKAGKAPAKAGAPAKATSARSPAPAPAAAAAPARASAPPPTPARAPAGAPPPAAGEGGSGLTNQKIMVIAGIVFAVVFLGLYIVAHFVMHKK